MHAGSRPPQHLILEMQIQALKNIGCGVELQIDRQDLRPCGIVTENITRLPAGVRSTINQAAEISYYKKTRPMIEMWISNRLFFCLSITHRSRLYRLRNGIFSN